MTDFYTEDGNAAVEFSRMSGLAQGNIPGKNNIGHLLIGIHSWSRYD